MPDELAILIAEIKKLVEKLDAPKRSDWSEKIVAITPFLSTVVLAGLSLWFTWSYQQGQIRLAQETAKQEQAFRDAQVRVAELEAISKLIPALSSTHPMERKRAEELLQAVQRSKAISATELEANTLPVERRNNAEVNHRGDSSLIGTFAAIFENDKAAEATRIEAASKIAKAASLPSTSTNERRRAEEVLARVARSPTAPTAVRSAAESAIADIRHVSSSQIADLIEKERTSRAIDEVILHHTFIPDSQHYQGF